MEIQKVFSDYYDTERIYSVLMDEEELQLAFSMGDNLRGNPELTQKIFGSWSNISVPKVVSEDLRLFGIKPGSDFSKFMAILYETCPGTSNIGVRVGGPIQSCGFFLRGYEDILKNFRNPKKTGFGVMNYPEPRVVLGKADGSRGKTYIISYIPRTKKYLITAEYDSIDLISRGVNKLLGGDKFEKVLEESEFKKAMKFFINLH